MDRRYESGLKVSSSCSHCCLTVVVPAYRERVNFTPCMACLGRIGDQDGGFMSVVNKETLSLIVVVQFPITIVRRL